MTSLSLQARMLASVEAEMTLTGALSDSLERMVVIQMEAYPRHWTEAERREMAERHLFGGAA